MLRRSRAIGLRRPESRSGALDCHYATEHMTTMPHRTPDCGVPRIFPSETARLPSDRGRNAPNELDPIRTSRARRGTAARDPGDRQLGIGIGSAIPLEAL